MSLQYVLGIAAALFTFGIVIEMLRRRRLRERHAAWWIIAGLAAIIISVFPSTLQFVASALGFEVPINLVFFASLFILFLVVLQLSSELTKAEAHDRAIVERVMILELKIEALQKKPKEKKSASS